MEMKRSKYKTMNQLATPIAPLGLGTAVGNMGDMRTCERIHRALPYARTCHPVGVGISCRGIVLSLIHI